MLDHPFLECVKAAAMEIEKGNLVFQKFTCSNPDCRQRLTMETPNVFYVEGTCDKCNAVTDISKQGCNYLMVVTNSPALVIEAVRRGQGDASNGQ